VIPAMDAPAAAPVANADLLESTAAVYSIAGNSNPWTDLLYTVSRVGYPGSARLMPFTGIPRITPPDPDDGFPSCSSTVSTSYILIIS
jgi:hypothetical protein